MRRTDSAVTCCQVGASAHLITHIEKAADEIPGSSYAISQLIQRRFNELISGVRADVAVKIFGDDLNVLAQLGGQAQAVLQTIDGAADVKTEQVSGLPMLTVKLNRQTLSRYGTSVGDVQNLVEIAVGGKSAGLVFEGDRRFDLVVRLPEYLRSNVEAIRSLPVPLPPLENQAKAMPALWGILCLRRSAMPRCPSLLKSTLHRGQIRSAVKITAHRGFRQRTGTRPGIVRRW
ncbi:cation efflux system protein CzcA [Afipia clevelandensis ATCC 49720]|jgi:cobalt-zinc-cadmium resistance protein CzcA|uniref:Cation efflux system protein CzcA n=1 Tax=Afipia clevelandensis ATCC 49720 TaxID=883079 RepID=K8NSP9_9BRAD|nr:cation efflux system protein CzcA [Afipia clevelandensis ATCC 49720]